MNEISKPGDYLLASVSHWISISCSFKMERDGKIIIGLAEYELNKRSSRSRVKHKFLILINFTINQLIYWVNSLIVYQMRCINRSVVCWFVFFSYVVNCYVRSIGALTFDYFYFSLICFLRIVILINSSRLWNSELNLNYIRGA